MTSFSRSRFNHLKKTFENGIVLLRDDYYKLWTYDDDAENLAEELGLEVKYNRRGMAFLTVTEEDMEDYILQKIDDEGTAFFLPYGEEPPPEPPFPPEYPSSTWLVADLGSADGDFTMIVVEDPKEVSITENIYGRSHPLSEALIEADLLNRSDFWYAGAFYSVRDIVKTDAYETYLEKQRHFLNLNSPPETINVYKSKSYTKDNSLTQTTALVFFSREQKPVKMNVWYSSERDEYFINMETLNSYRQKYGMPYILAAEAPGEHIFGHLRLAEQSIFNLYGYTVSEKTDLPAKERQEILTRLIDYKIVTKGETMNYLEGMISLNESNPNMWRAIEKWRKDLYYISTYDMKGPPDFWGTPHFKF